MRIRAAVLAVIFVGCLAAAPIAAHAATSITIAVTVVDPHGSPIQGATVSASGSQGIFTATSDSNGRATLTLVPDTYTLTISLNGFDLVTVPNVSVFADQTQALRFTLNGATPATPEPTPTPKIPGNERPVRDAILALYNEAHPEHERGTPYFGRYTYVLLRPGSTTNRAFITTLVQSYVPPEGPVIMGPARDLDNPWGYNLFLIPITKTATGIGSQNEGEAAATRLTNIVTQILKQYDWHMASNIRDAYCRNTRHNSYSICTSPYDDGPILLTFLRPIGKPSAANLLPPALAYDLTGLPSTEFPAAMKRLAGAITKPTPIVVDQPLPPSFAHRYILPLLGAITNALQNIMPKLKIFSDAGLLPTAPEK